LAQVEAGVEVTRGSLGLTDYDKDGDYDIMQTGETTVDNVITHSTRIFENN